VLWELSVVEQRYTAVQEVLGGMAVTAVADRYGVSRQSVHGWLRRYQAGGLAGLEDRSHRPRSCPHQALVEVETAVCELRRQHPGWGPLRLQHELQRCGLAGVPSRAGIYRILVRHQLVEPGRRRRRRSDWRRWERDRPMQLWQLDIVGGIQLADGSELKLVSGIDDHSRFCISAALVARATGRAVCTAFAAALARHGVPAEVLTDNGRQFTGRFGKPRPAEVLFDRICRENGITRRLTGVRSPTTTGKVERFHKTLRAELLGTLPPFPSLEVAQKVINDWVLEREGHAGLVCICAAAFALEALSRELLELRVVPPATTTAWARNRPPADRQILEVLKHGFDPRGLVATWERELRWLFGVRGSSVHYEGSFAPPEIHPLGMGVAPTQATYRAENAMRAVDLLLGILERCRDKPKPPIRAWSKHKRIRTPALLSPPGRSARRRIRSSCTRDCQRRSRDAALREGRRAGPFRRPALRLGGGYPRLKGLM
jgi:transposase InsO family protein